MSMSSRKRKPQTKPKPLFSTSWYDTEKIVVYETNKKPALKNDKRSGKNNLRKKHA